MVKFRGVAEETGELIYGYYAKIMGKDIIIDADKMLFSIIKDGSAEQYVEILDAYVGDVLRGSDISDSTSGVVHWFGIVHYDATRGRIGISDDSGEWYEVDDFNFEEVAFRFDGTVEEFEKSMKEV